MNSLFEVVLWGAPAVLLTCALLLAIVCGLAFREEGSPRDAHSRSKAAGA